MTLQLPDSPFANRTFDNIMAELLAKIPAGIDKREGSHVWNALAPVATHLAEDFVKADLFLQYTFVDTTYGAYLDLLVEEHGLARNAAVKAKVDLTVTGLPGTTIPSGTQFSTLVDANTTAPVVFVSTSTQRIQPRSGNGTHQETSESITYTGVWTQGSTTKFSSVTNDVATIYFNGTSITIVLIGETDKGIAGFKLDGGTETTVDLYQALPVAPVATVVAGAGLGIGAYRYRVTFVNVYGETRGGAEVVATTTAGNQRIDLSAIPTGPTGTTQRKIYRTLVGGAAGTEKLLTTLADNTTTIFADTTPDASLGASVPTVGTFGVVKTYSSIAAGNHNVVVRVTGTKNASSTANTIDVDHFIVSGAQSPVLDTLMVPVEALVGGVSGNVGSGMITRLVSGIVGVTGVTNASAALGGKDAETDAALKTRFKAYVKEPPGSGNKNDYVKWAKEASTLVGDANVQPLWNGNGTVKVFFSRTDGAVPDAGLIAIVQAYIDPAPVGTGAGKAPIGATVTVVAPTSVGIDVQVTLTVTSGFDVTSTRVAVTASINVYLATIGIAGTVRYAAIANAIHDTSGVQDYSGLQIRRAAGSFGLVNVVLAAGEKAVQGTYTIT